VANFPSNIKTMLSDSYQEKVTEQRLWDMSLKFLEGRQWLNYDKRLGEYVTSKGRGDSQTRVTVNLLLNLYRNILSRLALSYPSVVVLPASPSTEDIVKAKSSETALRYYWQRDGVKETMETAIRWLLSCGTCALHTYYDPDEQEVKTRAIGAYDVFFEKGVIHPDDSQWVALRTYVTKESLKETFPDKADEIEGAGSSFGSESYGAVSSAPSNDPPKDRVELFDIYWRDGRYAMVAGSTYLYKEESPATETFPVQVLRYTEIPRRLWGVSLLAPLLDLQLLYNKARSQVIHNVELMGNPKWLVPKTAGVSAQSMTSRPGEKIYYNPAGGAPQQIAAAPMPSYVMDNIMRIQGEMGDVAGIHSVTLGKRAVGVSSGKGMEYLGAQDTSQLQITQQAIERGTQLMAKCVLELMQAYYTEPKMMGMLDVYGRVTFDAIQSTDLVQNPEVFIEAGSLFKEESQDRDAKVVELLQLGLIDNQTALDELSFRTGNAFVSERVKGIAHARDMLDAVRTGLDIEIFVNDDLDAFKDVFTEFMRTVAFYELPQERQDYMRDILVSVTTAQAPEEVYEQAMVANKVFPRSRGGTLDPQAMASDMALGNSPSTQQQIIAENAAGAQRVGSAASAERAMTQGLDGNVSFAPGGRGSL
tara:strand:+ start:237 stop:2174 length:1938 start_codon:yes stop_codon:yes gene_type:complete